jgi:amino acid transporter
VLPASLGRIHQKWFSPVRAIIAQAIFTIVIGIGVGLWLGPGATGACGFTGTIGTVAIVIVYIMSNIALVKYFEARGAKDHHAPDRPDPRCARSPLPALRGRQPGAVVAVQPVPIIVLLWIVAGVVLYFTTRRSHPRRSQRSCSFITEEDLPSSEQNAAPRPAAHRRYSTPSSPMKQPHTREPRKTDS